MPTHAAKAEQRKTPADRSASPQSGRSASAEFADNRPIAAIQREQQELIINSPRQQQAAQLQAQIAQSPRQLAAMGELAPTSPAQAAKAPAPIQKKENRTGLPDNLKAGMENLSGHSLDDVQVHYNSAKPAQLQAHAYAQGTDIHLAPGQEKHLPHEAWHVVQQRQGRVKQTVQLAGVGANDDVKLEDEADLMGRKAVLQAAWINRESTKQDLTPKSTQGNAYTRRASPLAGNVIQAKGSGGQKLGFDFRKDDDKDPNFSIGMKLVRDSWATAKKGRHDTKTSWMDTNIKGEKFKGPGSATSVYANALENIDEEKALFLANLKPGLTLAADTNIISYKSEAMKAPLQIAKLLVDKEIYAENAKGTGVRKTYLKKGMEEDKTASGDAKEYVEDNEGVKTRRYAYVEKNFYQMMDFFKTGKMTGRFQQYVKAGGASVVPQQPTEKVVSDLVKKNPVTTLTSTQIAVAHQWMGSSPEQRGVSLTSTEKVGGTVGNAGKNFRDKEGFRLKIDLAKVPTDVLLINHYSEGGIISSDLGSKNVKGVATEMNPAAKSRYKYGASVRKNRELYLEYVQPEWVVEIEHHQQGGYGATLGTKVALGGETSFQDQGNVYARYWVAFDRTLAKTALTSPDAVEQKAAGSAKLVMEGYQAGDAIKPKTTALKAHEEVSHPTLKDKYSQWHLGYIRARVGKPMFKDSAEYADEMKDRTS